MLFGAFVSAETGWGKLNLQIGPNFYMKDPDRNKSKQSSPQGWHGASSWPAARRREEASNSAARQRLSVEAAEYPTAGAGAAAEAGVEEEAGAVRGAGAGRRRGDGIQTDASRRIGDARCGGHVSSAPTGTGGRVDRKSVV